MLAAVSRILVIGTYSGTWTLPAPLANGSFDPNDCRVLLNAKPGRVALSSHNAVTSRIAP